MDLDNLYGLFFVSIVIMLLVLVVNQLLVGYDSNNLLYWNSRDLENSAQYWAGKIISIDSVIIPDGVSFVNLESGTRYNSSLFDYNLTISYPVLLLVDEEYVPGRVIVGE